MGWGGGAIAGRVEGGRKHRFDLRDVKHRVNPAKSGGELQNSFLQFCLGFQ